MVQCDATFDADRNRDPARSNANGSRSPSQRSNSGFWRHEGGRRWASLQFWRATRQRGCREELDPGPGPGLPKPLAQLLDRGARLDSLTTAVRCITEIVLSRFGHNLKRSRGELLRWAASRPIDRSRAL